MFSGNVMFLQYWIRSPFQPRIICHIGLCNSPNLANGSKIFAVAFSDIGLDSTQSMRRVPKPTFAPRVYKRRYTRKGQSLRKDQHIKNRFSRELKDKKAEEARKEKNFDNVVSLTPKHYDPKKFQRIPKKTKGDEPVPSTSEKEPVPSTSKEASLQSTSKYSLESTVAGTSSNDTTADSCSS